jgi:hypothetical protein
MLCCDATVGSTTEHEETAAAALTYQHVRNAAVPVKNGSIAFIDGWIRSSLL